MQKQSYNSQSDPSSDGTQVETQANDELTVDRPFGLTCFDQRSATVYHTRLCRPRERLAVSDQVYVRHTTHFEIDDLLNETV
jgi:hypothetical protein